MSEHDHDCECGCGCGGNDDSQELDDLFVTLETEDGESIECEVISVFEAEEKQYIALSPVDEESEDLFFFRLEPDEEDKESAILVDIEDEEELELVCDAFDEILDEQEWEES